MVKQWIKYIYLWDWLIFAQYIKHKRRNNFSLKGETVPKPSWINMVGNYFLSTLNLFSKWPHVSRIAYEKFVTRLIIEVPIIFLLIKLYDRASISEAPVGFWFGGTLWGLDCDFDACECSKICKKLSRKFQAMDYFSIFSKTILKPQRYIFSAFGQNSDGKIWEIFENIWKELRKMTPGAVCRELV